MDGVARRHRRVRTLGGLRHGPQRRARRARGANRNRLPVSLIRRATRRPAAGRPPSPCSARSRRADHRPFPSPPEFGATPLVAACTPRTGIAATSGYTARKKKAQGGATGPSPLNLRTPLGRILRCVRPRPLLAPRIPVRGRSGTVCQRPPFARGSHRSSAFSAADRTRAQSPGRLLVGLGCQVGPNRKWKGSRELFLNVAAQVQECPRSKRGMFMARAMVFIRWS